MGEGNKKLSKRDPQSSLNLYREEGFLPEGMVNYLALLGWSIGDDREFFGKDEMAAAFDVVDVNASPARFDYKKCTAINADWIRYIGADDLAARLVPHLQARGALGPEPTADQLELLAEAVPLVQERMEVLSQGVGMLGFLFATDDGADGHGAPAFERDPESAAAALTPAAAPVLEAAQTCLAGLDAWVAADIEAALRSALVDGLGLKPKLAFGPVRVAVSGRRVSPPLFESMELLGRERSLSRVASALLECR
jgi:glutamyl-tRNA synthetase